MKYWTLFYTGGRECVSDKSYNEYRNRGSFQDIFCPGRGSDVSANELAKIAKSLQVGVTEEIVMIAMVEPTEEELLALGNAAVYDPGRHAEYQSEENSESSWNTTQYTDSSVRLALRPQDYDNFCMKFRASTTAQWGSPGNKIQNEDVVLIRDGKVVDDCCSNCDKILGRAAGKCAPPIAGCTNTFFDPAALITPPDVSRFLPHKECMHFQCFDVRKPCNLEIDISVEEPIKQDMNKDSAVKAGYTRSLRATFCKYCALAYKSGASYCCGNNKWIKPGNRSCNGPVFPSEFPKVNPVVRQLIHLENRRIPLSVFKEAADAAFFMEVNSSSELTKWRKDPEFVIGYYEPTYKNVVIFADRVMKNRPMFKMPYESFLVFADRFDYDLPEVPEESTPLENAVSWAIASGLIYKVINRNYGFGGPRTTNFTRCEKKYGSFIFQYQFASFNKSQHIDSLADLGGLYNQTCLDIARFTCSDGTATSVEARANAMLIPFRDGNKAGIKSVKKFMKQAHERESMGELLPVFTPVPLAHT